MKFFLIGFMGSGKSTIGKYVARHAQIPFMDLDDLIEIREGKTVQEIFDARGEMYFRELERDVLREMCAVEGPWLLSCGGGTPCFHDNMAFMNAQGITLYLDLSASRLSIRLRNAKTERPLLRNLKGDLQQFIHHKLMERAPFYAQAQHILSGDDADKKGVLDIVQRCMAVT